ncbi:MAG: hypothetical protein HFI33_11420 [Lachnospiraceae bacterium]|nr:hypothetical protein [Lachnospiraceae bacterium]
MADTYRSLLGVKEISALEAFDEGATGYFGRMVDYLEHFIETGVKQGRFTQEQAREDLEIALWYAYACNNVDDYEHYYMAAQWMPASEKYASGCGPWYYRYSCALMYCGRLKEAWDYAEKGVKEDPDYPWGWLQVGKLRSHFGDKEGALEAVRRGLLLEPEDFEFLTLHQEILEGRNLEQMEYHYIDPDSDRKLQEGMLEDSLEKQETIAGILCDQEQLEKIQELFQIKDWEADCPYCRFHFTVGDQEVEGLFRMNEAAVSKLDLSWLQRQREIYTGTEYITRKSREGKLYTLTALVIERDLSVGLVYQEQETGEMVSVCMQATGEIYSPMPEALLVSLGLMQPSRGAIPIQYHERAIFQTWMP